MKDKRWYIEETRDKRACAIPGGGMDSIRKRGGLQLVILVGLLTAAVAVFGFAAATAWAGDVDDETCLACHDDVGEHYGTTTHGAYFSSHPALAEYGCESCHGSGIEHIDDPVPENIINPANDDQFGSSMLCISCHDDAQFDEWSFSHHNTADLNCASCHVVHEPNARSLKKETPELCYDCHSDVRASTYMPSHHPIREGVVECQDCHAVHGGKQDLTMSHSKRELCFSCHADVEGPFVYEHAPVMEDCGICHEPHGAVADNLLKYNEPALCLNCHSMHFHTISESVPGDFTTPQAPGRAGTSTVDGFKYGMLTKCTQCHSEVHGSDLPSQAASNGGTALTR
ncbi:DmsE family decaheme c-type cytochrome [candidate division GN15 bacterium]|nr:DmsE family decaheme c-type cytochrome [candidate division GN15 bacterium]